LGAGIEEHRAADDQCPNPADEKGRKLIRWIVRGIGLGKNTIPSLARPFSSAPLDVGNSGTTLFLALAAGALGSEPIVFTGDEQIRRRSAGPLLKALAGLGIRVEAQGNNGCAPILIQGPWKGGRVSLPCPTSQYLSSLLLAAPLAPAGTITEIDVPLLNEKPYVELTLSYLDAQGITYEAKDDFSWFRLSGGASYKPMNGPVWGDFSSAAFPGCAAVVGFALSGGPVTLLGLEKEDPQGDKAVFDMLTRMGCQALWKKIPSPRNAAQEGAEKQPGPAEEWSLRVSRQGPLKAGEFDLNATPDLFPVMAAAACYAQGRTALVNVAHARIKETDRIAVMAKELGKLGIKTEERPDGLIIYGGGNGEGQEKPSLPRGGTVNGHGDHRVVMALAVAALGAAGPVEIEGAESAAVTYPGFLELLDAAFAN
jgi:3-phosphoshikimate 1-carboxyvinyltransferase